MMYKRVIRQQPEKPAEPILLNVGGFSAWVDALRKARFVPKIKSSCDERLTIAEPSGRWVGGWKQPPTTAGVGQFGTFQGFQSLRFSGWLKTDRHPYGFVVVDKISTIIAFLWRAGSGQTVACSPDALFRMAESKICFPIMPGRFTLRSCGGCLGDNSAFPISSRPEDSPVLQCGRCTRRPVDVLRGRFLPNNTND